jgi:hypothetical protein
MVGAMSEKSAPQPRPKPDVAAQTGRIAGRLVSRLGVRLLRTRTVREIVRRAHDEAALEERDEREAGG